MTNYRFFLSFLFGAFALTFGVKALAANSDKKAFDIPLSIVRHHWQEMITESNHAALRPGSIYDIQTYFEQNFGLLRPKFNYLFFDTGLGAADPIYPVYQSGFQRTWSQLLKAAVSDQNRRIDHYSVGDTPEGCVIKSSYWVRHINEFPEMYKAEREDGYTLVDISFDYYQKTRPDAQCGKHFAHEMNEDFDPFESIKPYAKSFRTMADIPPVLLKKYEAKIGILKLITEEFSRKKWPRYKKVYNLKDNSMWYYPEGFAPDYGINTERPQPGLKFLSKPMDLVFETNDEIRRQFKLNRMVPTGDFSKLMDFLNGRPHSAFRSEQEPGKDAFSLSQVTNRNLYTSGIEVFPIQNVLSDVSNPENFKLVSVVVRPYEPESDVHFEGLENIPQVRLIFQLMDPKDYNRQFEQLYLHVMFDGVDRNQADIIKKLQYDYFLKRLDALTEIRRLPNSGLAELATIEFIREFTGRPLQALNFSSSLTGIWVFGSLSRSYNAERALEPVRIVREGVDVGYYSTAYDTVLFREAAKNTSGEHQDKLLRILQDTKPNFYRDPRRHDAEALSFHRVTCAQCHQMGGRDGVHMTLNDHLDRRIKTPYRATEFLFRELDRQLKVGQ